MQEKAQILRCTIADHIDTMDIPGYLADEGKKFLECVNYYKLKNIYKHVSLFCDYLVHLDSLYYDQLSAMLQDAAQVSSVVEVVMTQDDDDYFLSQGDKQQLVDADLYDTWSQTGFDRYQLLSIIMRIKGLLLLSATEFCHASTTRLSIYQRIFHTQDRS
jgi:hypothetical protein